MVWSAKRTSSLDIPFVELPDGGRENEDVDPFAPIRVASIVNGRIVYREAFADDDDDDEEQEEDADPAGQANQFQEVPAGNIV